MGLSVSTLRGGWAAAFASPGLLGDTAFVAIAFRLRVLLAEEAWLAEPHGQTWNRSASEVPRWLWR